MSGEGGGGSMLISTDFFFFLGMANIADNVLGMADIPYSFWWKTLDAGAQPMYVADQSQSTPTWWVFQKRDIGKQSRPRTDTAACGILSRSTRFPLNTGISL